MNRKEQIWCQNKRSEPKSGPNGKYYNVLRKCLLKGTRIKGVESTLGSEGMKWNERISN